MSRSENANRAYIRLGRGELELHETDLGLFDSAWPASTGDNILLQTDTVEELCVVDSAANFLDEADVSKVDVAG